MRAQEPRLERLSVSEGSSLTSGGRGRNIGRHPDHLGCGKKITTTTYIKDIDLRTKIGYIFSRTKGLLPASTAVPGTWKRKKRRRLTGTRREKRMHELCGTSRGPTEGGSVPLRKGLCSKVGQFHRGVRRDEKKVGVTMSIISCRLR